MKLSNVDIELEAQGNRGELVEVDDRLVGEGELEGSSEGELLVESVLGGNRQVKLIVELTLNDDTVGQLVLGTNSGRRSNSAALILNFEGNFSVGIVEVSCRSGQGTNLINSIVRDMPFLKC